MDAIEGNPLYWIALVFFAGYPIVSSVVWVTTATIYYRRREHHAPSGPPPLADVPRVSVLVPAYNEESRIRETVLACLDLDYPDYEVVVVDDGSSDGTVDALKDLVTSGAVRLVCKLTNEGKAMALNDAIPCLTGELVLIVDADARPDRHALRYLVPHFASARVAAVTGNPRVVERGTLLAKLQVMEFTSIISLLRRAQRVWGRILTVSGVVAMFRVSALVDVDLFSPDMATEDIDVTWKLQKRFYDIRYEPNAIVWMRVPTTIGSLWRQRRRWALGLVQVLRRHGRDVFLDRRRRRMWPVATEAVLSIVWAYLFVILTAVWGVALALGRTPAGANPFPNVWGMTIATLAIAQLLVGVLLDRRYDRQLVRDVPVAVIYPLVYWMLMAVITVISTPRGLFGRRDRGPARWHSVRPALAAASE
ncbi:MAG: glycosyltransferase [Actinobacteria bacterium]|nr:glycosyltransferase [Actinomycetota bacterium]